MQRSDPLLAVAGWPAASVADHAAVARELGRPPRGIVAVAHRCGCGVPAVVVTPPRLPGGAPFPTTFYLTCSRMIAAVGTLESRGLMSRMNERLADPELAQQHRRAHEDYLSRRAQVAAAAGMGAVPQLEGVSAGGMPDRVKCLHVLAAHALAVGPGITRLGDEVAAALGMRPEAGGWRGARPCGPRSQVTEPSANQEAAT